LYPFFLAMVMGLFGNNLFILNLTSLLLMVGVLVLFYRFMYILNIPIPLRLVSLALFALHPWVIEYSRVTLTEAGFMLCVLLVCYYLARFEEEKKESYFIPALVFITVAFFTRYIGILLLVPLCIVLFSRKAYRLFWVSIMVGMVLVGIFMWRSVLHYHEGYLSEFFNRGNYIIPAQGIISPLGVMRRYLYASAAYVGDSIPDFLIPVFRNIVPRSTFWGVKITAGIFFFLIIIKGYLVAWRHSLSKYFLLFTLVYCIFLPIFPTYGGRYLAGVYPFLILFFLAGLAKVAIARKPFFCTLGVIFLLSSHILVARQDLSVIRGGYAPAWKNLYRCFRYIREADFDPQTIVLSRKPYVGYLVSGHKTIGYPRIQDRKNMLEYIIKTNAKYVIVDTVNIGGIYFSQQYLKPVVQEHKDIFRCIYRTSDPLTEVYQVSVTPKEYAD
ncbi:MAG: glycosyltransferase family 39 protein, partial [Candidatus Omnitrophica bacterium]|nr:glycosyltransferase family 39 protein [Candidatus Omnitrophota bacterium]